MVMEIHGYIIDVAFDGQTLTAEGTTKAARVALRGESHSSGPVVLAREDIVRTEWKPASALVNGKVTLHATDGARYQLHFRKKQAEDFRALASALGVQV